ncbi:hypothetical protein B0H16DRAFT_1465192 [Mycena metata]|uniref:Uncharacterized protein n=1 Tax=Mycena metata TaxID=1033252 RepID=A0AAD7IDT4_9AGAR|nr:hypothetical protein B0H16DRAFT_1465192 [Mycena metata]
MSTFLYGVDGTSVGPQETLSPGSRLKEAQALVPSPSNLDVEYGMLDRTLDGIMGRPSTPTSIGSLEPPDLPSFSIGNSGAHSLSGSPYTTITPDFHHGAAHLAHIAAGLADKLRRWIYSNPSLTADTLEIVKDVNDLEDHCASFLQQPRSTSPSLNQHGPCNPPCAICTYYRGDPTVRVSGSETREEEVD